MSKTIASPTTNTAGSFKRLLRRGLRIIVLIYVGICILIFSAQDWLVFPGASYQGKPETLINYGESGETVHFTTVDGIPITAVFGAMHRPDSPTILYFYGNASSAASSEEEFDQFRNLDCNVLIPDLAGYGASGGKASEKNFYATADAAWDYLQTRPGIDRRKIIVIGWSMGAGVAVDLASRKPVAGLATFNAFTSLTAMGRHMLPWLPTNLFLRYRFDNLSKIKGIHCPILICNGQLDTLIPPGMSDQLFAAAGGPATRVTIATADHTAFLLPIRFLSGASWGNGFIEFPMAVDRVQPARSADSRINSISRCLQHSILCSVQILTRQRYHPRWT